MRVLDLFSGIGGFSLGLERAGMQTVAFCEIDPFCRRVLAKHWPDVPIYDDVRELSADELGPIDLICGGFPCQPFSQAGKRRGAQDDRHLWPQMHRLVDEIRPDWVIGENVSGLIHLGLDQVLSDLEASGYTCRTFAIPAVAVDAPHRRERLWIVAHRDPGLCKRTVNPLCAGRNAPEFGCQDVADAPRIQPGRKKQRTERERVGPSGQSINLGNAAGAGLQGSGNEQGALGGAGTRQFVDASEACGGRWLPEPDVGRVASGISAWLDESGGVTLDGQARALARAAGVTKDVARLGCLRALRAYGELGEAPSRLQRPDAVRDSLSQVSHEVARRRAASEPYEAMRDLWDEVSALPFKETQDVFQDLLERVGKEECKKALGQRVSRLKALGNAVVPQVVEQIGLAIMTANKSHGFTSAGNSPGAR